MAKCGRECEVYSRVVGYMRPVKTWNKGKKEEFKERVEYDLGVSDKSKFATKQPISTTSGQTELK